MIFLAHLFPVCWICPQTGSKITSRHALARKSFAQAYLHIFLFMFYWPGLSHIHLLLNQVWQGERGYHGWFLLIRIYPCNWGWHYISLNYMVDGGYLKHNGKEKSERNECLRDKSIVTTTSVCFRMKINNAYKCTLNFKALYKCNGWKIRKLLLYYHLKYAQVWIF